MRRLLYIIGWGMTIYGSIYTTIGLVTLTLTPLHLETFGGNPAKPLSYWVTQLLIMVGILLAGLFLKRKFRLRENK